LHEQPLPPADNPADRAAVGPYGFDREAIERVVRAARDAKHLPG